MKKNLIIAVLFFLLFDSYSQDKKVLLNKQLYVYSNVSQLLALKLSLGLEYINNDRAYGLEYSYYLANHNAAYSEQSSNRRKGFSLEFNKKVLHQPDSNTTYHGFGLKVSYENYEPVGEFRIDSTSSEVIEFKYISRQEAYFKRYFLEKYWAECSFKYGKRWYYDGILIDVFGGVGMRVKYTQHSNYGIGEFVGSPNLTTLRDQPDFYVVPSIKFGVNIGFGLMKNRI